MGDETEVVGRYTRLRELGRGGFGVVWLARDEQLRRLVALKILHVQDPEEVSRFVREAQLAAALSHPNIAAVYDVGRAGEDRYIAMEYIEGEPLSRLRLTVRAALEAVRDAARALEYAHQQGIIHRDLKPQNLMKGTSGRIVVLDFGLARSTKPGSSMTLSGDLIGTPAYMSPEQARGQTVTSRSDVYGLGALLYELVAGRPPFVGDSPYAVIEQVVTEDPISPSSLNPQLPRDAATIILKALEKDPLRRYESAAALAEDLSRSLAGEPIQAHPPSVFYRMGKRVRRHPVGWSLGALLAVATAAAATIGVRWGVDVREREEARPHVDAGRRALMRLEALLSDPDHTTAQRDALLAEAESSFGRALDAYPEHPEALLELARVAAHRDRRAEAIAFCDRAIAASPALATARLERAMLRLEIYEEHRHAHGGVARAETAEAASVRALFDADLDAVKRWAQDDRETELAAAYRAFADGRYADAAEGFRAHRERVPGDVRALEWEAHASLHSPRGAERAVELLTKLLTHRPRHAVLWSLRAVAREMAARGGRARLEEALEDANRAIELEPDFAEAWVNRGILQGDLGDPEAAILDYDRATALKPDLAAAHVNRAIALARLGRADAAIASFTRAADLAPFYDLIFIERGKLLLERDPVAAIADFGRVAADAEVLRLLGLARQAAGDAAGAERDFSRSIEASPSAVAHVNRGLLRAGQGDLDAAVADWTRAIDLDGGSRDAYLFRADARRQRRDEEAAESDFTRAIDLGGGTADVYCERGHTRLNQNKLDAADEDYARAIELAGDHFQARLHRGQVRLRQGRPEEALAEWEAAADLEPSNPGPWIHRAQLHGRLGDVEAALDDYDRAVAAAPSDAHAAFGRGLLRMQTGDDAGAIEDFDRAIAARPDWGTPY